MSRYAITSLGPAEQLGAAQIPLRAHSAMSYASRGVIDGQPGTLPIPAPPPPLPQDLTGLSQSHLHRSSDAPNVWYPGIYYEANSPDAPAEHAPVSVFSDNQMPVPAVNPLGIPSVSMGRPRLGGQYQVRSRAAVPAYPGLSGG
jgi:hypothetical protein